MGAVTVALVRGKGQAGLPLPAGRATIADVTFSSSYATGGDTFTAAQFNFKTIDAIIPQGGAFLSATTSYDVFVDIPNLKLKLMGMAAAAGITTGLTEIANATNVSTVVVRVIVFGDNPHI